MRSIISDKLLLIIYYTVSIVSIVSRYYLILMVKAAIPIMLPTITLLVALFANFKMYLCTTTEPFEMDFLLDGAAIGQFDSR